MGVDRENRIGIVGGGQLGRMMTIEAIKLGYGVTVIDPTPNCPASQVGAEQIKGSYADESATRELAGRVSNLTFEIEQANTVVLKSLEGDGLTINPSTETLDTIMDKMKQKEHLAKSGIPLAPFMAINDPGELEEVANRLGYPFIVKTRFGGFDGRGNLVVASAEQFNEVKRRFANQPIYAEQFVNFDMELAVMVARSVSGDVATFPVVQTIHQRNICHTVLAPAPVDLAVQQQARELAIASIQGLTGAGVFGVEMFRRVNGRLMVNEMAPRVHNSCHFSIEGCRVSQFMEHVRAVAGLELEDSSMICPAAVMVNILGERNGETILEGLDEALKIPGVAVHLYGKSPTKIDRKMGHVTAVGDDLEEARKKAELARRLISI